ncbi:uncharacterized protein [Haliotis cracherodii]|uniref:uncharacterized protein n=1 Tax=Haliotis cracherodii TaxID=6455 RepID=UPI0039E801FD
MFKEWTIQDEKKSGMDDSGVNGTTSAKDLTGSCEKCQSVERRYEDISCAPNLFVIHTERPYICAGKRSGHLREKKKVIDRIGKVVSALRNSGGGHLLVHIDGQESEDRCLEQFDEAITKSLTDLIEDGQLYVNIYKRQWLSELPLSDFQNDTEFIWLNVESAHGVATVDFNTKIRDDIANENPPYVTVACLLSTTKARRSQSAEGQSTQTDTVGSGSTEHIATLLENPQQYHENRNIEYKALKSQILKKIGKSDSGFADYIWTDLKLKYNVTSMSKVENGGSFYVGIAEVQKKYTAQYGTKVPHIEGFQLTVDPQVVTKLLLQKLKDTVTVLKDGTFHDAPDDLIEITFHKIPSGYVLEVAVRYCEGLVFYDKEGPRAYEVKGNEIRRIDKEVWLRRFSLSMNNKTLCFKCKEREY